jgi:hypothetical protein
MSVLDCCVRMGMDLGGRSISAAELKAYRLYALAKARDERKAEKQTPEEGKHRQKEYRLANREAILAQRKIYYEQNGDKLRAAKREAYRLSKESDDRIRVARRAAYHLSKETNHVA